MDAFTPPWLIWFVIGIGLAFLELQLPGFVVIFFGVGCLITAAVLLVWDPGLDQQILIFLVGSVGSLLLLRKSLLKVFSGVSSKAGDLDDTPVGLRVKVVREITPELPGRISYRGSFWNAVADEAVASGETVEIVGYADTSRSTFKVKKI